MKKLMLIGLLVYAGWVHALTLDDLQQQFSRLEMVRAKFEQQRQISGMAQPLRSSGEMLMSREQGLCWWQQKPFVMSMMLNDERMVQTMNGQAPQVITAQSNPQMFQFNHLLRALFQADRQVLEQNFTMVFSDLGGGKWQLVLTPQTSPLDKLFNTIGLQGGLYLERIEIDDKQGDRTQIVLSEQRSEPATLTPEERQCFAY